MNVSESFIQSKYNDDWKIEYANMKFFTKQLGNFDTCCAEEEKATKLKKDRATKLYKYYSFDLPEKHSLKNLYNSQVYLRNPNKFNDPFDSVFSLSVGINDILETLEITENEVYSIAKQRFDDGEKKLLGTIDEILDGITFEKCNLYRDKTWVTCFSETHNSILMWSHYADKHTGFCVEYDFLEDEVTFSRLNPVLYVDKLYNLLEHTFNGRGLEFCTLLKSVEWSYEKEWRLVVCNLINDKLEYWRVPKPTAIYLGLFITDKNKNDILNFGIKNNIDIYQMKLSSKYYKLTEYKIAL